MWRNNRNGPAILLLLFSSAVLSDTSYLPSVTGAAYDRDNGNFLYTEQYYCAEAGQLCTVQYRDTYGALIAHKRLDYRKSQFSPALTMTDYRQDMELTVPAKTEQNIVVDAGFDNYVRSIWDQLDKGESVRFSFLVVGFKKPFAMRAVRRAAQDCDQQELCLQIKPASWLLGMLAKPIELAYTRVDRKLRRFSGVSNIKGEGGETRNVNIYYQYANESTDYSLRRSERLPSTG